jgi:hypothetical protein
MLSFDVINLSDTDLQTCVEEFVKRAVTNVRSKGISLPINAKIEITQYGETDSYKIKHQFMIGSQYGLNYQSEVNNLIQAGDNAAARAIEDMLSPPIDIVPMIAAPTPQEDSNDEEVPY